MFNLTTGERQIQLLRELYFAVKRDRDLAIQKIRSSPTELVCGKFRCRLENESIKYFVSQYVEEREEYSFEEFYGINDHYYNYLPSVEIGKGGMGGGGASYVTYSYNLPSVEIIKGGVGGGGVGYITYSYNLPPGCLAPSDSPVFKNFSIKATTKTALLETWREEEIGTVFYTIDTGELYSVVNGPEKFDSDSTHIYSKQYQQLSRIHNMGLTFLQDAVYSVPKKQKVLKEREVSREEFLREPFELI